MAVAYRSNTLQDDNPTHALKRKLKMHLKGFKKKRKHEPKKSWVLEWKEWEEKLVRESPGLCSDR